MTVDTIEKPIEFRTEDTTANELLAAAEAENDGKPLDFGTPDETGLNEEKGPERTKIEDRPENPDDPRDPLKGGVKPKADAPDKPADPVAERVDYMKQAMERARSELKQKTDLTDDQITSYIYQRFLTGGKHVQKVTEARNKLQTQVSDLGKYQKFHTDLQNIPLWKALMEKRAKIVMLNPDGSLPDPEDPASDPEPMPAWARGLQTDMKNINQRFESREQQSAREKQEALLTTQTVETTKQIEAEEKSLSDAYPQFKVWLDWFRETGLHTPEFEEVLERVEKDGVTMTYAVKAYFADHGLPTVVKAVKDKTIKTLKKKAGQKSETTTVTHAAPKGFNYANEDALAEHLVSQALAERS